MKQIIAALILVAGLFGALQNAHAVELSLGSVTLSPDASADLSLSLSGGTEPYAGVNAKILLPKGVSVTGVTPGALLTSKNFVTDFRTFSDEANEGVTLIAYSAENTFSASGVLLLLKIQAAATVEAGIHTVAFATENPNPFVNSKYALSNADGSKSVEPSVKYGAVTVIDPGDSDNDGLPDTWEQKIIDANPNDAIKTITDVKPEDDFDKDGFSNISEYNNNTDPTANPGDTDKDGLPDEWEQQIIAANTNDGIKTLADVKPEDDFDGDGFSNAVEYSNGTNPTIYSGPVDPLKDDDKDGLPDIWERQIINANTGDSIKTLADVKPGDDFDGDGFSNLAEYDKGSGFFDPTDPAYPRMTLAGVVAALKAASGLGYTKGFVPDIDGDGKIGVKEAVFFLRGIAGK